MSMTEVVTKKGLGPCVCPKCGETDNIVWGEKTVEDDTIYFDATCLNCDTDFYEAYDYSRTMYYPDQEYRKEGVRE